MTDLEKEFFAQIEDCFDREGECDRNKLEPLIRSHTQALVAAAYAACAEHIPVRDRDGDLECSCGWASSFSGLGWADHIHSLTPAGAARELERIKATCERLAALEAQAKEKPTKPDAQEGFLHKLTKEEVKNCAENPDYEEEP